MAFETKDSGQRIDYPSGFRRDLEDGKPRYDLIPREEFYTIMKEVEGGFEIDDIQMFKSFQSWVNGEVVYFNIIEKLVGYGGLGKFEMLKRLAELYERGAKKYGDNNWQLCNTIEEANRFIRSAFRHFMQYLAGETDEDHLISTIWNIISYTYIINKLKQEEIGFTTKHI